MNKAVERFFAKEYEDAMRRAREEIRKEAEEKDRHRVLRMYKKGRPVDEIADLMELNLDTVENWINEAESEAYIDGGSIG